MKIEIEASWADVDVLQKSVDLIVTGDMVLAVMAGQARQAAPQASTDTVAGLRSLAERVIGKLPPRGTVP